MRIEDHSPFLFDRRPWSTRKVLRASSLAALTALVAGCVTTAADMQPQEAQSYKACLRTCEDEAKEAADHPDDSADSVQRELSWCRSDCNAEYRTADWTLEGRNRDSTGITSSLPDSMGHNASPPFE